MAIDLVGDGGYRSVPLRQASVTDAPVKEEVARTHVVAKPTAFTTALEMNDDLSALLATALRRRREGHAEEGEASASAWISHVLDEDQHDHLLRLQEVLQAKSALTAAQLRELIFQLFPDPSDAALALRELMSRKRLVELLGSAMEELHDELLNGDDSRHVRAGINVLAKARLASRQARASASRLRESYRYFLGADEEPTAYYELWIEEYGFEQRHHVVDFIEQALAADIYAVDPSCSRIEFGRLLHVARRISTLRSVDNIFMRDAWHDDLMKRINVEAASFIVAMLRIVRLGRGFGALFRDLLQKVKKACTIDEKIIISQRLRRAIKALPHGVWRDAEDEVHAVGEIDQLIDASIKMAFQMDGLPKVRA